MPEFSRAFTVGKADCDFASLAEALVSDEVADGSMRQLTEPEYSERELKVSKSIVIKGMTEGFAVIKAREPEEKARDASSPFCRRRAWPSSAST